MHREPDNLVLKGKWIHYIFLADAYLSDKVVREADKAFEDKYCPQSVFEKWKNEHFRGKR